jgi:dTDP-4-dehydrorhamnose reductase
MNGGHPGRAALELWGGVECTVNRVGDRFHSQIERLPGGLTLEDLDRISDLGIAALRFPVLWERVAPDGPESADWRWSDARLARLQARGVRPIIGLLHHGSGPAHTSLADPRFAMRFADFAATVAARYPDVREWTPINEPLTTARFSGLYGLWYPHGRDAPVFWRCLANQCRATVLAMRAIRAVRPDAQLVQTDDLGRCFASPGLEYQAEFNNRLRWLGWDLLCGRVDRGHALRDWLLGACGATADELDWFRAHACPPDVIGINHYVTSDRYLDAELSAWPSETHGGNGREAYADVEAVRALPDHVAGSAPLLREAWERYRLPLAVTEVHVDAPREDQLRWVAEAWEGAQALRAQGVPVRAVTLWSLLGACDWNSLLTREAGYYETGAFDARSPERRPTALVRLASRLARGDQPDAATEPALAGRGWWRRPVRLHRRALQEVSASAAGTPILVTGATGTLGAAFARLCQARDLACRLLTREQLDIGDARSIAAALDAHRPWAVVNAAGYVRVDEAERDAERCFRENARGPGLLAAACAARGLPMITFSSDLVFDGRRDTPYLEHDAPRPLNVYGHSKAEAEQRVLEQHPGALVVRTSSFFGPWDSHNFVSQCLRALREGQPFPVASDLTVSPTYVPDLVQRCLDLLVDRTSGLCHLSNGEPVTWVDLALRAASLAQVDASALEPRPCERMGWAAARPNYSALGSTRAPEMPSLDDALRRYLAEAAP